MFDDIKPGLKDGSGSAGKEPDDIFSESDKTAPQVAPPTDQPPAPQAASPVAERLVMAEEKRSFPWKAILLVVGILVVVGAAFYISVQILSSNTPVTPEPPADEVDQVEEPSDEEIPLDSSDLSGQEPEEEKVSTADSDKDGLTDVEEEELGTSSSAADTDGDGLFDLEEVKTWRTDPLNPDTDGDTYLDGEEVSGGYNPSGDGTLREPPTESD